MEKIEMLAENEKRTVSSLLQVVDQGWILDMMKKIADATGMGIAAVNYCGNPVAGTAGYCDFCQRVQMDPTRKRTCEVSTGIGEIQAATIHEPYIYVCPQGLLEVTIPIVINGEFLGGFIAGQIHCDDIPPELSRLSSIFSKDVVCQEIFREEFDQTTKMTFHEFEATAQMIYLFITEIFQTKLRYISKREAEVKNSDELRKNLREDEITILRMQMNRNFIIRSITSIANMAAVEDAVRTNEMAGILSKFLWNSEGDNENYRFLCDELEVIKCYLMLQQQINEFEYEIDLPEDLMLQRIPSMMLFPIVEQAFYCGVRYKEGGGKITIKVMEEGNFIKILINDNGFGMGYRELKALFPQIMEEYPQEGGKSGLELVRKRLEIMFPHSYEVKAEMQRGEGTAVSVQYPRSCAEGEE